VTGQFHFLLPLWLFALPAIGLAWWLVRLREANKAKSGEYMAAHLRDALLVNADARRGVRAVDGVCLALIFAALAAAGPAWTRLPSPWFEETAPLVIAMEVWTPCAVMTSSPAGWIEPVSKCRIS